MTESAPAVLNRALNEGQGVLRLAPTWVPRAFNVPGRRLRLHTADLYALGGQRGGISERWLASTVKADNGPLTAGDEGLSYIAAGESRLLLTEALALDGAAIIGAEAMARYGGLTMFSKLFDNLYPLPHHLHQSDAAAAAVGRLGKPEAYFFPAQYNATLGTFPYTFFGLEPGTTKDEVVDCLKRWDEGDNGILLLSKAYRLQVGTGWDVETGILHAPGSLCTYEPQRASDVYSMWQSLVADSMIIDRAGLVKDVPPDKHDDYDYLLSLLDWDANVDPNFKQNHFTVPRAARPLAEMEDDGYRENWIVYGSPWFSAKELTVYPGQTVTIRDAAAYGALCVQGCGRLGPHTAAAPTLIRYGQMTEDEFFVTDAAARAGVTVVNLSQTEPLVLLKHFNPGNPEMPARAGHL